ncbi:MAG TPA: FecR family protein [Bacteroidales bacterium]|nr:FecR family protein [Bacteroidales bacterium]
MTPTYANNNIDEQILDTVSGYQPPFETTTDEALAILKKKIAQGAKAKDVKESKTIPFKSIVLYASGIAASLLAIVATWYFFSYNARVTVLADKGQHTECVLPDGSVISLNAKSAVTYRKQTFRQERFIEMEGEAFFNIKKGSVFTIKTKHADIKILGTSFNVYARESMFKVACVTGRVLVANVEDTVIIEPGESASLFNRSLKKFRDEKIASETKWRNGEFIYENASLKIIFEEIERQFNVNFALPDDVESKYFTGGFSNKNLVDALDIVCIPMGLTYEIGANGYISVHEKY